MARILVLGGQGQLGLCLQKVFADTIAQGEYVFLDEKKGDVTNKDILTRVFQEYQPTYVINCSAYTAVDKAEDEKELAEQINALALDTIANLCDAYGAILIHVSTDFVFSGKRNQPYSEVDEALPLNVYGITKLTGEKIIQSKLKRFFIIRTSWLYSEYANNFMKTMLRIGNERNQLQVVDDQIGTPTYAIDLANIIVKIVSEGLNNYGIYHFSNEGIASWYDFAYEIFQQANITVDLQPIPTSAFPAKAKRPAYSVLDKSKIKREFSIKIDHWKKSLKVAITALKTLTMEKQ